MGFFDIFRSRPPIPDLAALADFADENSAFLVQKGIYEYCRARAGHYAKVLFSEPEFLAAAEHSRWSAWPLGLAMVAEVVEGILRQAAGDERHAAHRSLNALVLSVFDRYPVPASIGEQAWAGARQELQRRLGLIGLHATKPAMDIPEPFAQAYFDLIPLDPSLRTAEFPTIHNYLRVTMCNIHDEFSKRADVPALAAMLCAR